MGVTATLPGLASGVEVLLDDRTRGAKVTYERGFIDSATADRMLVDLVRSLPLEAESPIMFGRPVTVRRRTCGIGEKGLRYRYSGIERVAHPWPSGFAPLLDRLEAATGSRFNFALCNLYPDGDVGLGWHSDDEHDLARDAPIASLSFGAERDFMVRLGRVGRACLTVALESGSLLVMGGALQRFYQHRVPPRRRCEAPRLNLTFRVMR